MVEEKSVALEAGWGSGREPGDTGEEAGVGILYT